MARAIVIGSSYFTDEQMVFDKCLEILENLDDVEIVTAGDELFSKIVESFAKLYGYSLIEFATQSFVYGDRPSVAFRNMNMINYTEAVKVKILIAFCCGEDPDITYMLVAARSAHIDSYVFMEEYNEESR